MSLKAFIAAAAVRIIGGSLRYRFVLDDNDLAPHRSAKPMIYVFWHEMLLLPAYTHSRQIMTLVSRSKDGAMMAEVVRSLGGQAIRGSTDHDGKNRGGRTALREMLRQGQQKHIGIPIDGPVGPRRITRSAGVAWVASHAQMPVVPVGIAVTTMLSVGRRDKKINLPLPFSCAWFVVGKRFIAPPDMRTADVRGFMQQVQTAMDEVQSRAETYASAGAPGLTHATLKAVRQL